ncbi:hypothetical protein Ahy_B04g071318 [Arachis hypogaea]|uniref:Protein FAR1-RELATED SEQUENCE n=1 Tax=Arachis hypogaea TaxID=3818 RepID=A0A444ZKF8_ARAHY|nr:hypothetical protein Ahy_B04g071318 [Arachis hypogaea]
MPVLIWCIVDYFGCILQFLCDVDEQFVPKVGMTFNTLEDAAKFFKDYLKAADFSTRVRNTNKKGNEIKNQLITCSREEKWKSKISPTEKTNPSAGLSCPARIYIHILKDIGVWIISKVVLHHSHPCCANQAEMLKQHRELSMSVHRTIENNEEARIIPRKTYQSFMAAAGGHRELNFIEKYMRNYITMEKINPSAGLSCPARIYIHILKDIGVWIIFKVVLHHSHPCCTNQAEMLKQHRELSMSVRRTIENNEEARIRPRKTYQSFVAAVGGHRELNFIEKDVRNYITREVQMFQN